MYWNYRVICKKDKKSKTISYEIHEVYYSKKGKIKAWTEDAVPPFGESEKELNIDLKLFKKALKLPVLVEKKKDGKNYLHIKGNNK